MSFFSFHQKIHSANGTREITVNIGDMCKADKQYDAVVVSAFAGDYAPFSGTLIGSLEQSRGISVEQLSRHPEIDLRSSKHVWLSKETGNEMKRIACVELIDRHRRHDADYRKALDYSDRLLSLRMLLVWARESGIAIHRIAMPFIGTGNQSIDQCFIVTPLLKNVIRLFDQIAELEGIDFYELNFEKAKYLADVLEKYCQPFGNNRTGAPDVFISYSSYQQSAARTFRAELEKQGISCWMAPESIPHGSDYTHEIPKALGRIGNVVLLLSEEAENSRWVALEISTGIGNKNVIFPCQLASFTLNEQFSFMLRESQIRSVTCKEEIPDICAGLAKIIKAGRKQ